MNYVIIGGDAAGMSAAMQIWKYDQLAKITVLEKGGIYSYAQCGLPYAISGQIDPIDRLIVRTPERFRESFGMDPRVFHEVNHVDPKEQLIFGIDNKTNEQFTLSYDKLLIATGADPFIPNWNNSDINGIFTIKTIPDAQNIQAKIDDNVENITIIGGGYIALEMAESFRQLDKQVRLILRSNRMAKIFDHDMQTHIENEAKRHDIDIIYNEEIKQIHGNHSIIAIETNNETYPTDLLLVATGIRPNTSFLDEREFTMGKNGALHVDEFMRTNVMNVYAAGDCAMQYNRMTKKLDYIPLGTNANKQGRVAGMNMVGKRRPFAGIVGSSILRFMDQTLGKTGLSNEEARRAGFDFTSVSIKATNHAGYYPDASTLFVKLTVEKKTGRLLGGQIIGKDGADKRVDVLATALFNEMTVLELEQLDLSYAPPFNSTWDPLQQAARKAASKLDSM